MPSQFLPCFGGRQRPATFSERFDSDPRGAFEEWILALFCCNPQATSSVNQGIQASFVDIQCCFGADQRNKTTTRPCW